MRNSELPSLSYSYLLFSVKSAAGNIRLTLRPQIVLILLWRKKMKMTSTSFVVLRGGETIGQKAFLNVIFILKLLEIIDLASSIPLAP